MESAQGQTNLVDVRGFGLMRGGVNEMKPVACLYGEPRHEVAVLEECVYAEQHGASVFGATFGEEGLKAGKGAGAKDIIGDIPA